MGKITTSANFSTVSKWEELRRFVSAFAGDVVNQINGKLSFQDNVQGQEFDLSFPVANQDVVVTHNLGYEPHGFFIVDLDAAAIIYSNTAPNPVQSFFKSSVANVNARVRIY